MTLYVERRISEAILQGCRARFGCRSDECHVRLITIAELHERFDGYQSRDYGCKYVERRPRRYVQMGDTVEQPIQFKRRRGRKFVYLGEVGSYREQSATLLDLLSSKDVYFRTGIIGQRHRNLIDQVVLYNPDQQQPPLSVRLIAATHRDPAPGVDRDQTDPHFSTESEFRNGETLATFLQCCLGFDEALESAEVDERGVESDLR